MIVENFMDFEPFNVFIRIHNVIREDVKIYLKCEMFNPGGSIKFKPAVGIVRALETEGALVPGNSIIDTTSGNMGIALSMVARAQGYGFVCVSDDKITEHNRALIQAYGADLVILPKSTLKERYDYIGARIRADPTLVWTRQFTNRVNPLTHETTTARDILDEFPKLEYLFIGAGTAGTLSGCAAAFAQRRENVNLVAVDAVGSAHFGRPAADRKRLLPGIGATERSPFLDDVRLHDRVIVAENETVSACRELVRTTGWLLGASSGSVLAAIKRYQDNFKSGDIIVGVAADSGERYLNELYNEEWLASNFPEIAVVVDKAELERQFGQATS